MPAKRIRCICGKVYDPEEQPRCPNCGTEVRVESISIFAAATATAAPTPASSAPPAQEDRQTVPAKRIPWLWIGGAVWLIAVITVAAIHFLKPPSPPIIADVGSKGKIDGKDKPPSNEEPKTPSGDTPAKDPKLPNDPASTGGTPSGQPGTGVASGGNNGGGGAAPANTGGGGPAPENPWFPGTEPDPNKVVRKKDPPIIPDPPAKVDPPAIVEPGKVNPPAETKDKTPKQWVVEAKGDVDANGAELAAVIAKAGDGDTITLRGGSYAGDLKLSRPVHLVGEADKASGGDTPVILSDKRPCVSVESKGIVIENIAINQIATEHSSAAIRVTKDSELTLVDCVVMAKANGQILGVNPASITATNCRFVCATDVPSAYTAHMISIRGPSLVQFTKCGFFGGETGIMVDSEVKGQLRNCKFQDLGAKNGKGAVLKVFGTKSSITADKCEFTGNRVALVAENQASLAVTNGTFTDGGVGFEKGNTTNGIIAAKDAAKVVIIGSTFKTNNQGLQIVSGSTAEIADCHFIHNGIKVVAPGGKEDYSGVDFLCLPLTISGQGSTATVTRSDFTESVAQAIHVLDGGSLTLEDSEISAGGDVGIIVGRAGKTPARADIKRSRINRNPRGVQVAGGCFVTIDGGECLQNGIGLSAEDSSTRLHLAKVTIAESKEIAFYSQAGAEIVAEDCTIQNNARGAQAGRSGKSDMGATASLQDCKLLENQAFDALACEKSTVVLKNCAFSPGGKPKVSREKDGVIQADPPIGSIASGGTTPAQKEKPTASNNKPPVKRPPQGQRYNPSQPQQPSIPDDVNRAIDAVNALRRFFR